MGWGSAGCERRAQTCDDDDDDVRHTAGRRPPRVARHEPMIDSDREQFVCPRVHEIRECNSGDGGGKIEPRCPSGAPIESWVQPWRFPRNIQVGPEMVFFDTAEPASTDYGTVK